MLVAVTVLAQTMGYVTASQLTVANWVLVALLVASAACLVLGLVTPVAAVLIGVTSLVVGFSTAGDSVLDIAVLSVVIALLGPGAFSIDARMFGRREILIPVTRRQ